MQMCVMMSGFARAWHPVHGLGIHAVVKLGYYHMDRIVLSTDLPPSATTDDIKLLPWLFRGFEVKYRIDEL